MSHAPAVSTHQRVALAAFELVLTEASRFAEPSEVKWDGALPARATVGAALAEAGRLDLSAPPRLDALDAWYRTRLPDPLPEGELVLVFEGLATIADVWLDGGHLVHSESMFAEHEADVTRTARPGSELVVRCRALGTHLAAKRPRPRWRTRLVDQQQLRWIRTSLIGRTPGFCPSVPVVGPHRPVWLESRAGVRVRSRTVASRALGRGGEVRVTLILEGADASLGATLEVDGAAGSGRLALSRVAAGGDTRFEGVLTLAEVSRWWPHTHGPRPMSHARIVLSEGPGIELGRIGFRELAVDRDGDGKGFGLVVNDVPVFCRGACWTTCDLLTLGGGPDLRRTLELVRDAGMNMLRIGGTMTYESDEFHDLCDELGILVFQDFMFANMDYPVEDPGFRAAVETEVRTLLGRIGHRPSLAVLCGGSEVEQQASMLGLPRELWQGPLFYEVLPRLSAELAPSVPYVPGSPHGGPLPFQTDEGITHYYGVGAYLRPLDDARRSRVRFAAECLAFSNVPSQETIEGVLGDLEMPFHHPRWKERVPRDRGVGWDFEDVRDHYVRSLFGVEPRDVRYADPDRYLALGRAAVGEVIEATFSEFRREGSSCRGALVFYLKDFWDGAGWGVIDARGTPKSAYYHLKRVLQPLSLLATDEGLNGIVLHATNDRPEAIDGRLEVILYRSSEVIVARADRSLRLEARSTRAIRVDEILDRFADSAYAYRFGPPGHDLLVASLVVGERVETRAFHSPLGPSRPVELDLGLTARLESRAGELGVALSTRRFAQNVSLEIPGYLPEDDSFHVEPGGTRLVRLVPGPGAPGAPRGTVSALNSASRVAIRPLS